MPRTNASEVAGTILSLCAKRGIDDVSNLKLQKLTYYAEAWYLAFENKSLYSDRIEAWIHGPVIPTVFKEYRDYRWAPLQRPATRPSADADIIEHLNMVLDTYGKFSAQELERLTHSEAPWTKAREGYAPDEPANTEIDRRGMKLYYRSLVERQ
jgi:uncharacterized phage-associated protein